MKKLCQFSEKFENLTFLPQWISRVMIGYVFVQSGWGKLTHLEKVIGFFQSLGIPAPHIQAPLVASLELICGAAVLVGFWTRWAAIPLMGIMAVAVLTAKHDDVTDIGSLFAIYEFVYIVVLLWLVTRGAGPLSIDHFCQGKSSKKKR